ncbi:MAG: hypothetical protein RR547_10875, partial [Raoultibacter sp.]
FVLNKFIAFSFHSISLLALSYSHHCGYNVPGHAPIPESPREYLPNRQFELVCKVRRFHIKRNQPKRCFLAKPLEKV